MAKLIDDKTTELEKAKQQIDAFEEQIKQLTLDRMNEAPKQELEPQTKMSQNEIAKSKEIYLKPAKSIGPGVHPKTGEREKFNEKFRDDYNFQKEYVHITAEHKELIGETLEFWSKPFPGMNMEFWQVPTNKPVWVPRYVAEQISRRTYHRLTMNETTNTGADGLGQYYGTMAVDNTISRMEAHPVSKRKSLFMGAHSF